MIHDTETANAFSTTAPLRNVSLCATALDIAVKRELHLPGMVVFHGPSGYGKSTAAAFVANRHRAYYVEVKANWTRRFLLQAILRQMGLPDERGTIPQLIDTISEQLVLSRRPLIIDEMDNVVDRHMVNVVEDIYRGSAAPILMIGEERLPKKLERWEKFHGRVLEWVPAQPVLLEDARHLRQLYVRKIEIADDLLEHLVQIAEGSARRIVTNLDRIAQATIAAGLARMDRATWGERPLYTGKAPAARL